MHNVRNECYVYESSIYGKEAKYFIKADVSLLQILLSLPKCGLLLKERICSLWEQILSLKRSPYLEGANSFL